MKADSTGICVGCMCSKSSSARAPDWVWPQKDSNARAKSGDTAGPEAFTSLNRRRTRSGSPDALLTSSVYVASDSVWPLARTSCSTFAVKAVSLRRTHSDSMVATASSETGTPSSIGSSWDRLWSLHANSTSWATMCCGAADGVVVAAEVPSAPHSHRLLSSRKWCAASSKLPAFSIVFVATTRARVVMRMPFSPISPSSARTWLKLRMENCMAKRTS
mmetsp:Transcript_58559/g.178585  ORF Transcript_58559/g.178585 Transcript_58559/m.178585 type:complete len:218 (+) Transcript_58559:186-839(+)